MGVTQEKQKCIFMLCMEVAEEDMEVQEETVIETMHSWAFSLWTLRRT